MKEPLLDPEHRELEEGLLRAGREVRISSAAQSKTLAALGLGALGAGSTLATKAGVSSVGSSKLAMISLVGAAVIASGVAVVASRSHKEVPPQHRAVAPGFASPTEAPSVVDEPPEETPSRALAAPAPEATADVSSRELTSKEPRQPPTAPVATKPTLADEVAHLGRVERALAAGNPKSALLFLEDYRAKFSRRSLGLEAEILTIQALHDSGSLESARLRARQFVRKHPSSPLVVRAKKYEK